MQEENNLYSWATRPDPHNTEFIEAMARYHFVKDWVKDKRVLDAGCGFGYGTDYLGQWAEEVIGVDRMQAALDWAKKNYRKKNIKFICSDLTELDFPDEYFDVICLFEVIYLVKEYEKLLKEMHRVLKNNGFFLVSTRHKGEEKTILPPTYVQLFKAEELKELLLKIGFNRSQIYGLDRPEETYKLEKKLEKLRKFDLIGLKRFIPRRLISLLVYFVSKVSRIKPPQELGYESFVMSKDNIERSPGILAICQKVG
jgi:ubiquinone/menaquinone biosynthesis C-methylase UbiE